jgi:hypothetical protein
VEHLETRNSTQLISEILIALTDLADQIQNAKGRPFVMQVSWTGPGLPWRVTYEMAKYPKIKFYLSICGIFFLLISIMF